jgi:hypothetical protein
MRVKGRWIVLGLANAAIIGSVVYSGIQTYANREIRETEAYACGYLYGAHDAAVARFSPYQQAEAAQICGDVRQRAASHGFKR